MFERDVFESIRDFQNPLCVFALGYYPDVHGAAILVGWICSRGANPSPESGSEPDRIIKGRDAVFTVETGGDQDL